MQQDKVSDYAHFITLTYDPDHVPISENGFMTLDKSEFPRYMKRLRKIVPAGTVLKYYACGEYGTQNKRPHYHAIIFGCPDDSLFFEAWKAKDAYFGEVHVGSVSGNSVAYCMKYIDKRTDKLHCRDDRVSEFSLMSKGLGKNYISEAVVKYHKEDLSRLYLTVDGGHKIALPRYYKDKIYDVDDRAEQGTIVELAIAQANSDNYDQYLRLYAGSGLSYDDYVQAQREGIVSQFYSRSNTRM